MTPENIVQFFDFAKDATVTTLALLGVLALVKGWVVTRGHHDEVRSILEARIAIQAEIIRRLRNGGNPNI